MPVVINGSTGISGTDGSASTPAVQGTDTNTGLFFPAADTIAFAEGGTEVMRIDSAGRVGIGDIPGYRLDVAFAGDNGARIRSSTLGSYLVFENVTGAVVANSSNTPLVFTTNNAERMRIDASGNVGIGTTTPTQRLSVDGNATFTGTAVMASSFLRNRLINGGMEIDQRNAGASVAVSSLVYTLDRWAAFGSGGTITVQRVAGGASGFQNAIQITGGSGVTQAQLYQRVESSNCWDLASRTVTLSFTASSSSLTSLTAYFGFPTSGAADNWSSGGTLISQVPVTLSSTPTRFSVTVSLPAGAANGLQIMFFTAAFTSGTLTITGVQLEVGSVATPFERRQFGQELALCQRYYQLNPTLAGGMTSSNARLVTMSFGENMRSAPTYVLLSGTNGIHYPGTAFYNITAIDTADLNYITLFSSTNFGANIPGQLLRGKISASAEL